MYIIFVFQREHSNIITNLRATNEPLLCVTEHVPTITETMDDGTETTTAPGGAITRGRKKVVLERNTSAPLPGMLQVTYWGMGMLYPCKILSMHWQG